MTGNTKLGQTNASPSDQPRLGCGYDTEYHSCDSEDQIRIEGQNHECQIGREQGQNMKTKYRLRGQQQLEECASRLLNWWPDTTSIVERVTQIDPEGLGHTTTNLCIQLLANIHNLSCRAVRAASCKRGGSQIDKIRVQKTNVSLIHHCPSSANTGTVPLAPSGPLQLPDRSTHQSRQFRSYRNKRAVESLSTSTGAE